MKNDDVRVVRFEARTQRTGEAVEGSIAPADEPGKARVVLSMPVEYGDSDELMHAFQSMLFLICKTMWVTDPASEAPAASDAPPPGDEEASAEPEKAGEFEIAVASDGVFLKAFLTRIDDLQAAPGQSQPLAVIPMAFVGDEAVAMAFRKLVEAIGLSIARTQMGDGDSKPTGGLH